MNKLGQDSHIVPEIGSLRTGVTCVSSSNEFYFIVPGTPVKCLKCPEHM